VAYKQVQDKFWSDRRILVSRVKAMTNGGSLTTAKDLPIKTINLRAFERG
jgi:hypothetical protein